MLYLDNAATTPLSESTKKYIISLLDEYGNPSSKYSMGESAKNMVEIARSEVSRFINANPEDIYFTSGGSASNTMAIRGYVAKNECSILYSPIAHKSVIKCIESCNTKTTPIPVDNNGRIIIEEFERLCLHEKKPFVVIDYVNSEVGVVQNLKRIVDIAHLYNGVVYVDCTASISTIPMDVQKFRVDMCGFSGHKLGSLKGVGVLYKTRGISIEPLIYGTQENGLIGGTENTIGIATLGRVLSNYKYEKSSFARDYVYGYISGNIADSYLVGSMESRVVHNLYMCFRGVDSESLMLLLDLSDIQVSTGSACNSNEVTPSHVLKEISINEKDIYSCIRMTFSGNETKEDLDYLCEKLKFCVGQLRDVN